jgi:hypothetical protein
MRPYAPGDNIYQTGADERFNSFSDPSAMAFNQQNGNWGVNPNLMTPSYTSAYRPTYNGSQGNPFGSGPKPGFGQSVNQIFNPFAAGGTNYGGNTYQQQSPYFDSLGYNPLDHAANIAQKWAVPGFASWMSYKYLAKPLGNMGSRLGAGMVTGIAGNAFSPGTTAVMGNIGGGLGRLAFEGASGMVVGQMASWAADKAIFDPYVAQRQMTNDMRRNFAGVTFDDGSGNSITGKGFSRGAAARQASQISHIGSMDMSFNQSEIANMTDLASRAGLMDTAQGGQIADRMKSIVRQVKTVMQIANTSDMRETIEILAKLQNSGVASKDVSSVMTRLGGAASQAGVSVQKMMNTVGAQGEYLFAANGMTPYVGQLTAANSYGAFAAARRSGLLSNELLARMGGVEGATQSSVGAQLAMAQSPYAGMASFNMYLNGGKSSGGVVGNVSKFGAAMAADPITGYGRFDWNREALASKSLEQGGRAEQANNIIDIARSLHLTDKDGKLDAYRAFPLLQQTMGLTRDQARAWITEQQADQDPKTLGLRLAGISSSWKETRQKWLENEGYSYSFATPMVRPILQEAHEIQAGIGGAIGNLLSGYGNGIDRLQNWSNNASGRGNDYRLDDRVGESLNTDDMEKYRTVRSSTFGLSSLRSKNTGRESINSEYDTIQKLKNNQEVIQAIKEGGGDKLDKIIQQLAADGAIDSKYLDSGMSRNKLRMALETFKGKINKAKDPGQTNIEQIMGVSDSDKAHGLYDWEMELQKSGRTKLTDEDIAAYNKFKPGKVTDLASLTENIAQDSVRIAGGSEDQALSTRGSAWKRSLEIASQWDQNKKSGDAAKDAVTNGKFDFSNMKLETMQISNASTVNIYTNQVNSGGPSGSISTPNYMKSNGN